MEKLFEIMSKIDKSFKPRINENFDKKSFLNQLVQNEFEKVSQYYNAAESTIENFDEGSTMNVIFDIPKTEMNRDILNYFNEEHSFDSHGVGGNPGGMTVKSDVRKYNKGDHYRIVVYRRNQMDI